MDSVQASPPIAPAWAGLDAAAKRGRLLDAAERVFGARGFDAPMPDVARAAGAGVGSLYRQFPSKEALVAALAERRLRQLAERVRARAAGPDAWAAIEGFVADVLGDDADDPVSARAVATTTDDAGVAAARQEVRSLLGGLVDRGIAAGQVRADATFRDVIIAVRSARAARSMGDAAWRRAVALTLDGLRAGR
ncbi:MAG: TetR/AcrR family transcriptional regulator [Thermoleophilia bacterium]|nr:TetR/AcrR family transcriptional regulator [Thermoleophilia bacterium]